MSCARAPEREEVQRVVAYLDDYLHEVAWNQTKPTRRMLREMITGTFVMRSMWCSHMADALREPGDLFYGAKRLSQRLGSDSMKDGELETAYLRRVARRVDAYGGQVVCGVDESDIAKPCSRFLPYLRYTRDGSTNRSVPGYPFVAGEVCSFDGLRIPLLPRVYSTGHPTYRSQRKETVEWLARVVEHLPEDTMFALDRGYESRDYFKDFLQLGMRFVARIKAGQKSRFLRVAGENIRAGELARTMPVRASGFLHSTSPSSGDKAVTMLGWLPRVEVMGDPEPYSVVRASRDGQPEPMLLLTNHPVMNADAAKFVADAYMARWYCEKRFALAKFLGLESIRSLTWRRFCRMATINTLATDFVTSLVDYDPRLASELITMARVVTSEPRDPVYRVARVLGYVFDAHYRLQQAG